MYVGAIRAWVGRRNGAETTANAFIWCCFFCSNYLCTSFGVHTDSCCCIMKDNQFRLGADNADDLDAVFEERLLSSGRMLALLDALENPLCECPLDFVCSL